MQHEHAATIACTESYTLKIDLKGNITGCSAKLAARLGLEVATLLGQPLNTLLGEPLEVATIDAMKTMLGAKGVLVKQCTLRHSTHGYGTFQAMYRMYSANEVMISFEPEDDAMYTHTVSENSNSVVEALQLKVCLLDEEGFIISISPELAKGMAAQGIYLAQYHDITLFGTMIAAKFKTMVEEGLQGLTFEYYVEAGKWVRVRFRVIDKSLIVMQLEDVQWEKVAQYLLDKSSQGIVLENEEEICYTNQKARELLGIIEADKGQMRLLNFIHFDYKMTFLEVFKSSMDRVRVDKKCYVKTIAGKEIEIEYRAEFVGTGEKSMDHYYINEILPHTSIQKRHQTYQETIDRVEELNGYDRIQTKVLTNLSHEFRTPINIILSALQLIKWEKTIDTGCLSHLDKIEKNTYRLMRLVNNLLVMGQVDIGSIEMHLKDYDMVALLGELVACANDYTQTRGINLSFVSSMPQLTVGCDKELIEHILLNLLSNAVKATKPGGKIEVRLWHMEAVCMIVVSDTGHGIPVDKKEALFKRFGQTDPLWNRQYEGSGIGIPLVKALVELHGGEIAFESEADKGTVVMITLPIYTVGEVPDRSSVENRQDRMHKVAIAFSDIY